MGRVMELAFSIKGSLSGSFVASTAKAAQSLSELKSESSRLKTVIKETERAQKILEASFKAGATTEKAYAVQMEAMKSKLSEYREELVKNANARAQAAQDNIAAPEKGGGGGLLAKASKIAAGVATFSSVYTAVKEVTGAAIDFESAMADVRKVVDFDTPQQFKDMQKDILELTRTLPMSAEEIAKIVASGGQAGIAKDDLLSFAESAAKMGVAFDITADEAGDMMAKWRTAFKMGQSDVVALADKINFLGNNTAASAPLISDVVTRIGPLGDIGGVASGEIAALGASIVGAGINSEVAATGIKNLILGMTAGKGATKAQAEAFAALGMNAETMAGKMQTDAKGAITEVLHALQGLDKEKQAAVLKDLFGKESIGAIAPLLSNLDALEENFNKVADASQYAGSMDAEFAARCETTENALKLTKNAANELAINIGSALLPYVKDAAEGVSSFVKGLIEWVRENPDTVAGIRELATVLGAMGIAYWLAVGISSLRTALQTASLATRAMAAAQAALNFVMSMNPVGLVVMGIVALIAIGYELYQRWETVKDFLTGLWESPAVAVLAFITGPIGRLIYLAIGLITHWDEVKAWFILLWNDPGAAVGQFIDLIQSKFSAAAEWIRDKWAGLRDFLSHPIEATVNFIRGGDSAAASASGVDISENADGGIYRRGAFLTSFAEKSAEAAIPIDGSPRALALWRQTGEMLGVQSGGGMGGTFGVQSGGIGEMPDVQIGGSAGDMNISLSIPVTIQGNADSGTIAQIQASIDETVERALARIMHRRGRVSFA